MTAILALGLLLVTGSAGQTYSAQEEVAAMFDQDTETCRVLAQSQHPQNIDKQLDAFLFCLGNQVKKLPDDDNGEITDLKDTLQEIEDNINGELTGLEESVKEIEDNDLEKKSLNKRDLSEEDLSASDEVVEEKIEDDKAILTEEGRKWKKSKNRRKRPKIHKEETKPEARDEEEMTDTSSTVFTKGVQFSAYSGQSKQPIYRPGAASKPERQEQNMLMYGMDGQGNPQYINEDVVSLLLQNPQAKKAIMKYLSSEKSSMMTESSLPAKETPGSGDQYSRPPYQPQPGQPTYSPYQRIEGLQPLDSQQQKEGVHPTLNPAANNKPTMQYFGPKDYVPEVGHLVAGGHISLPTRRVDAFNPVPVKKVAPEFLLLEPKPRKKRSEMQHENGTPRIFTIFTSLLKGSLGDVSDREAKNDKTKKKNDEKADERCPKCDDDTFMAENKDLCYKCILNDLSCRRCRSLKYFQQNRKKCQRCEAALSDDNTKQVSGQIIRVKDGEDYQDDMVEYSLVEKCLDDITYRKGHPKICSNKKMKQCLRQRFRNRFPNKCIIAMEKYEDSESEMGEMENKDEDVDSVTDLKNNKENDNAEESEDSDDDKQSQGRQTKKMTARLEKLKIKCSSKKYKKNHDKDCNKIDEISARKDKNKVKKQRKKKNENKEKAKNKKKQKNDKQTTKLTQQEETLCNEKSVTEKKHCKSLIKQMHKECSYLFYRALNFAQCSKLSKNKSKVDEEESEMENDGESDLIDEKRFSSDAIKQCEKEKSNACEKLISAFKKKCVKVKFRALHFHLCSQHVPYMEKVPEEEKTEIKDLLEKCKKNVLRTKKKNLRKCFTLCNNLDYAKELKRFCKEEDSVSAGKEETFGNPSSSDAEDLTSDNTDNTDAKQTQIGVEKMVPEEPNEQSEESEKSRNKENIINIINDVISIVMETNDDVQSSKVSTTEATTLSTISDTKTAAATTPTTTTIPTTTTTPSTTVEVKTREPPAETTPSS